MTTQSSIAEKWAMEVHSELKTEELIRLFQRAIDEAVETADLEWMRIAQRRADKLAALDEAHAWQPIATAPRDGTNILCYANSDTGRVPFIAVSQWSDAEDWISGSIAGWFWPFATRPTHWQPLPKPPSGENPYRCDSCERMYDLSELNTVDADQDGQHTTFEICDDCHQGKPPSGELTPEQEDAMDADNEADAERIWKETGGVDKEGQQWLTPRMHRKANKLIEAWAKEEAASDE